MTLVDHNLARNPLLRDFAPQTGLVTEKKKQRKKPLPSMMSAD